MELNSVEDTKNFSKKISQIIRAGDIIFLYGEIVTGKTTFTRFFIPYLNDFKGWAVFCDCDFVWKIPSTDLQKYCAPTKAVVCVQHDYKPKEMSRIKEGDIIEDGKKVGSHPGYIQYTVGQRKGLKLSNPEPRYVSKIDPKNNTITVGKKNSIFKPIFA